MATQRILAATLAGLMAFGMSPVFAQQAAGVLAGRATDEAKKPYRDYAVQLRDAVTGQVINMAPLTEQGQFAFKTVPFSRRFLLELTKENKVVCTEGPYGLEATSPTKTDVNIECARAPAALWLLTAAAGTVAAVAVTTHSTSE